MINNYQVLFIRSIHPKNKRSTKFKFLKIQQQNKNSSKFMTKKDNSIFEFKSKHFNLPLNRQ